MLDACSDPANLCIRHGSLPSVGLLPIGRRFSAPDHKANLVFQSDGDLVVYDENDGAPWGSNTFAPGSVGIFQADGNLVVDSQAGSLLWATGTNSHPDDVLVVQGDGNVAIYDPGNVQLWATHTNH